MKTCTAVIAVLVLSALPAPASTPAAISTWTYGGPNDEAGRSMQLTPDGGTIIAGYTRSFGAGGSDVWLLKTDFKGDTDWTRTYGGFEDDEAYSVDLTSDGGYIIAGMSRSNGNADDADIWLIKTSSNGDIDWTRTFGIAGHDEAAYSVVRTADGGYAIACDAEFAQLIVTDAQGKVRWMKTFNADPWTWMYRANCVRQAPDGGFLVAGDAYDNCTGGGMVARTDPFGNTIWTSYFEWNAFRGVCACPGGGTVVVGQSFGRGSSSLVLYGFDPMGGRRWGSSFAAASGNAVEHAEGGFVAVGNCAAVIGIDLYLLRVNLDGFNLWTRQTGGDKDDEGFAVHQTADHGLMVVGTTRSDGAGGADVWLVRYEPVMLDAGERTAASLLPAERLPTVVRSVLVLPGSPGRTVKASLFDANGRKVMDLHAGSNDVRRLSPGLYFVQAATPSGSHSTKVTLFE